ncbi:MAG: translation initiation factor IF-2 [Gemmatimonadaceae bacterium]
MSKLSVSELASEFAVSAEEVVSVLRSMDIPIRSHMSMLTDDQVARIRARWEREKRARAEKQAAPAPSARRRRAVATPEPVPEPTPVAGEPVRRRRKAADVQAAAEEHAAAEAAAAEAAAEIAEKQAAAAAETARQEAARIEALRAEEAAAAHAEAAAEAAAAERGETRPEPDAPRPVESARPAPVTHTHPGTFERPRPRPVTPGAPRPRPVASSGGFPPRPIASAAPGGGPMPPRRDDNKRPGQSGGPGAGQGGGGGNAGSNTGVADRSGRRKKGKRGAVDQEVVDANISKTMATMRGAPARRSSSDMRRGTRDELEAARAAEAERERKTVRVNEFITVSELAQILKVPATEIVGFAFKNLGLMVTINLRLDFDQIELIAGEFGFQAVREDAYQAEEASMSAEADAPADLLPRPAIVTIMGHVDHGKTSLLDYIRKANVVAGEAGGITQHIGAYHVQVPSGKMITFLDTPGHEAFTAMRARGAQVTDIVVLVVAADDSVMPQTIEAISHAKNAGVPLIVAINKIDLPQANPGKVKQELLQYGVVLEEFGGAVLSTEISAKKGTNVDKLLDQILLQAEILDLKANPNRRAVGTVVEAQLDPGKGPVATVLVQSGTLKVGDDFICGMYSGRVRALLDERGKQVKSAGPAIPVQILGFQGVPMAGDQLTVVEDAAAARDVAQRRERLDREARSRRGTRGGVTLEDFMAQAAAGVAHTLNIVIKADQGGPAEALADALIGLSTPEVRVEVIHRGVGAISESDILLARTAGAVIIGFHVRPDNNARTAAEREGVEIKLYRIIYEAVADVRSAMEGMLRPEQREVILGEAEVRNVFKISRLGTIAGCSVRSGVINRQGRVRVVRDGVEVFDGTLASLKRFKDDVKEVREGFECGLGVENFNDLKVGDVIECYRTEEVARTLESTASA